MTRKKRDEGSIYSKAGKWYARLRYTDAQGNQREKKRTARSFAAGKAVLIELRAEINDEKSDRKTYTFLDQWFRDEHVHAARIVDGKVLSGFRQKQVGVEHYLDAALAFFREFYIDEITYADLKAYKKHIADKPIDKRKGGGQRSISDINHHLKRVRRLLNIAIEQGWLTVNPFKRGPALITESFETERDRILTPKEEMTLLAQCTGKREHLAAIIIFAIETCCRRGEIEKLRWSAVDLTKRVITIEATNTKTLKPRLVPVSARLRDTLTKLRGNRIPRPTAKVFTTGEFRRSFETAVRLSKLKNIHFHDLRHTAITRMLEAGIPQPLVMKISGHTQLKTFLRYVNQTERSILEIALKLDQAA